MKPEAKQLRNTPVEVADSKLPPPVLTYLGDGRWRLEEDYSYQDGAHAITVPAGFEFDLSSVPRAFWWLISPFDLSVVAPLMHDYLYKHGGNPPAGSIVPPRTYTRREVDGMFRTIMERENVAPWRRSLAYLAVTLFARGAWRE